MNLESLSENITGYKILPLLDKAQKKKKYLMRSKYIKLKSTIIDYVACVTVITPVAFSWTLLDVLYIVESLVQFNPTVRMKFIHCFGGDRNGWW